MTHGRVYAVVPAAGHGNRFGGEIPKQYRFLNGRSVLEHTLSRLAANKKIEKVVVAIADDDSRFESLSSDLSAKISPVLGGAERCQSVLAGLAWLCDRAPKGTEGSSWVMVHDAARPCLRGCDIDRMLETISEDSVGAILGVPVGDTLKLVDNKNQISSTVDRSAVWRALTPQLFRLYQLRDAIESALGDGVIVTDEGQAMERMGLRPILVQGHGDNIKITNAEDLALAELIIKAQGVTSERLSR